MVFVSWFIILNAELLCLPLYRRNSEMSTQFRVQIKPVFEYKEHELNFFTKYLNVT